MKLVLIGSPGAGKGTQAKILSKHFDIAHISTGELLREEINSRTELGLKIIDIMNNGELVSDNIVKELLSKRVLKKDCKNGFILDGYPRNVEQAQGLYDVVGKIDKVILISVPDEYILERMMGRRSCEKCGQMYHIKYNPPKQDETCDKCLEKLVIRKDDTECVIKNRIDVYNKATAPIIKYYEEKGIVIEVSGVGNIEDISKEIINVLED